MNEMHKIKKKIQISEEEKITGKNIYFYAIVLFH